MSKLRATINADGEVAVVCSRCSEQVVPAYSPILDYYNCPDCDQPFDDSSLVRYFRLIESLEQAER